MEFVKKHYLSQHDSDHYLSKRSHVINVRELVQEWISVMCEDEINLNGASLPYDSIAEAGPDIPFEIRDELFIVTSPLETLYPGELAPQTIVPLTDVPEGCRLQSIRETKEKVQGNKEKQLKPEIKEKRKFKLRWDNHLAHKRASLIFERKHRALSTRQPTVVRRPEAIITLFVIRGQTQYTFPETRKDHRVKDVTVLQGLGCTTLSGLRDAIKCPRDHEVPGDFSTNPDRDDVQPSRQLLPSSMFFIEDVFYVDRRNVKYQDYSLQIQQWLRTNRHITKDLPVKSMEHTLLADLSICLGQPYLYVHQGNCEHIIQFTDIRQLNDDDCQMEKAYPICMTNHVSNYTRCNVCQARAVKWMVKNSELSPSDPSHYCDICFKMFHYNTEGEKIGNFQAYFYTDETYMDDIEMNCADP